MEANILTPKNLTPGNDRQAPMTKEAELMEQMGIRTIPFRARLSFEPLIREIEERAGDKSSALGAMARLVLKRLEAAPALRQPIDDMQVMEENRELVSLMMAMIVPPALKRKLLAKVSAPFGLSPVYCTPALGELMQTQKVNYIFNASNNIIYCAMIVNASSLILNKFYNKALDVEPPFAVSIKLPGETLERHYKMELDSQYVDIKLLKPLKPLSTEQINRMLSNIYDTDLWLQYLPPENFEFQGFVVGTLIDITAEEALSRLKYSLLERDAVIDEANISKLQQLVRNYLNLPDLRLGLTAIDYPLENAAPHKYKIRFDFLAQRELALLAAKNKNSIYDKVCRYKEVLLIEDLEAVNNPTPIEKELLEEGIRSIIVAPLFNKDKQVIGLLEIGSPQPFELHSFVELKFKELTSLFSMAVERSRDEIDNRIEAIIREQYTAVHPSVEWKFIEASHNLLEKREKDPKTAVADPIVFNEVYPLYGQADIVSSSEKRNHAIQADLADNLNRVIRILDRGIQLGRFPLLSHFRMLAERDLKSLKKEFNSNDESRIVDWLHSDVHPLFHQIRNQFPELAGPISSYFNFLDPALGIVYRERKAYEDSVTQLNNTIANYLVQQQQEAQKILPHYFEKYKTDGVEYDIYVGQSLLNKGEFSLHHLKNLRLWQLVDMCEITRLIHQMQNTLPIPLTTAQLIFAYSTPLSIRFRMDEKQFDVDGAYNVRYEILKKRIDKALIEDTNERLTQPGKIAIVYLQEKDRQEYLEYADFLLHEGYITEEVERLRIGRLQGVQGLQALRLTVKVEE
ncbi:MAG: GAF domain-containing protein [Lewinellaceae bacterium]|nr:GAF domain-containing protein [Lewinellaceae bacterium]